MNLDAYLLNDDDDNFSLPHLPNEIWIRIFSLLSPSNLQSITKVSREFLSLSSDEGIWEKFCIIESKIPIGTCETWKQRYNVQSKYYCANTFQSFKSNVNLISAHAKHMKKKSEKNTQRENSVFEDEFICHDVGDMLDDLISFAQLQKKNLEVKNSIECYYKGTILKSGCIHRNASILTSFFCQIFGEVILFNQNFAGDKMKECQIVKLNHVIDKEKCLYLISINYDGCQDQQELPCVIFVLDESGYQQSDIFTHFNDKEKYYDNTYDIYFPDSLCDYISKKKSEVAKTQNLFLNEFGGNNRDEDGISCLYMSYESIISETNIPCYFITQAEMKDDFDIDYDNVLAIAQYLGFSSLGKGKDNIKLHFLFGFLYFCSSLTHQRVAETL